MAESDTVANGIQVNVAQVEQAAKALANADSKNWESADVRNRYSGLALATVRAYLTPVDPVAVLLEQR